MKMKAIYFSVLLFLLGIYSADAQLIVNKNISVPNLVKNVLIGNGVSVSNITYSGSPDAFGKFTNGSLTTINLNSGLIMSTGDVSDAPGPNSSGSISTNNGTGSDPQLQALIPGFTVNDAAVIEFDFVPIGDTLRFRYVFGSDEYPEFVNSSYNDVFGFFVSGPNPAGGQFVNENIALIPGTTLPVTIDNVNDANYSTYYYNNTGGVSIEYDGHTVVLTAEVVVTPCMTYHFKIAIGDAGDYSYDSGVFLEEGSFSTDAVEIKTDYSVPGAGKMAVEGCNEIIVSANLNQIKPKPYVVYIDTMWGTATNGVDFPMVADSIVILPAHLTGELVISPIADQITEGIEYFYLVIQTSICNVDTVEVPIVDYTPVELTTTPDTLVCEDSLLLQVDPQFGHPPYTYSWSPSTAINNPSVANPMAYPQQTTNFVVTVTDTTACPAVKDTIAVTVSPKPSVGFMPTPISGCEILDVNFTDMSSSNVTKFLWRFGDGSTSTSQNPVHSYSAGNYGVTLQVETAHGCTDSLSIPNIINVYQQPVADFSANPQVVSVDDPTINFTDLTGGSMFWFWNFGDPAINSDTSTIQNPSYTYSNEGTYMVMLITYNDKGCADTTFKEVRVIIDKITIPNVITPNDDSFNDQFVIENIEKLAHSRLIIYNRWGKKVYEMENYRNNWDADGLADGTYYYILEYETLLNKRQASGSITVLRE